MSQIILYIYVYIYIYIYTLQKNGNKGFIGRSLPPSVTNDQVTLKVLEKHSTSKCLTSQVKSGSSELYYNIHFDGRIQAANGIAQQVFTAVKKCLNT